MSNDSSSLKRIETIARAMCTAEGLDPDGECVGGANDFNIEAATQNGMTFDIAINGNNWQLYRRRANLHIAATEAYRLIQEGEQTEGHIGLKHCRRCSAPCSVQQWPRSESIPEGATMWMCSNSIRLGGTCEEELYYTEEAWNDRSDKIQYTDKVMDAVQKLLEQGRVTLDSEGYLISVPDSSREPLP